ncbi:MAG: hypothetical protein ACI3ZN_04490 [Candidatus Cryptobacteroides sp.]
MVNFMCCLVFLGIFSQEISPAAADSPGDEITPIIAFLGATSAEDLDEETIEHYSHYLHHPLPLNIASEQALLASGLLSPYQVAALTDCISTSGDILSFSELALIDGFGSDFVRLLTPFITLESSSSPGHSTRSSVHPRHSASLKSAGNLTGSDSFNWSYGAKWRMEAGNRGEVSAGFSKSNSAEQAYPSAFSLTATLFGKHYPGKIIIGDYKARFGQGLAMWNSMSFSGFGAPESFLRRSYGFSSPYSFTGSGTFTGLATDFGFGRLRFSVAAGLDDFHDAIYKKDFSDVRLVPVANAAWLGRRSETSLTFCCAADKGGPAKLSLDSRVSVGRSVLAGEICTDLISGRIAFLAGATMKIGDKVNCAVNLRSYPSGFSSQWAGAVRTSSKCEGECGVAIGMGFRAGKKIQLSGVEGITVDVHSGTLSVDAASFRDRKYNRQVKVKADYTLRASPIWGISLKFAGRFRDEYEPLRLEARAEMEGRVGLWTFRARADLVRCTRWGTTALVDAIWKDGRSSLVIRAGTFFVDNWSDRIYVYEPDAPGNFNVPALYGRGAWGAVNAGVRLCRQLKLWTRCSYTGYFYQNDGVEKKKPGKAGLKLMLIMDF